MAHAAAHDFAFVDLFAGCGGLSCGLEMAGLRSVVGMDADECAMRTYLANFPESKAIVGRVGDAGIEEELRAEWGGGRAFAVVGGPPCQGLSLAGKRDDDDVRNTLPLKFAHLAISLAPRYVVMEEVPVFETARGGTFLSDVLSAFAAAGYTTQHAVLHAVRYGVPQARRRFVLVACRADAAVPRWPPTPTHGEAVTVGQAFAAHPPDFSHPDCAPPPVLNTAACEKVRMRMQGVVQPSCFPNAYRVLDETRPSRTITTQCGFHSTGPFTVDDPVRGLRRMSVHEAKVLQSFPQSFRVLPTAGTTRMAFRQIGNAVPPLLARAIGKAIIDAHLGATIEDARSA